MSASRIAELFYPTDFSDSADAALDHVGLIARRLGSRVVLYHALEIPDPSQPHWAFDHASEVRGRVEREARDALLERARRLGVPYDVVVERAADGRRAVVSAIQARHPDLAVLGRHARSRSARALVGSAIGEMLRQPGQPLLCVGRDHCPRPYQRILLPTDLAPASRYSFPLVASLARAFEAEVVLLHVAGALGVGAPGLPTERTLRDAARRDMDGVAVTARVVGGSVCAGILEAAKLEQVDLIAMSTGGRHGLPDAILGSQTERVLNGSPCPLLVA